MRGSLSLLGLLAALCLALIGCAPRISAPIPDAPSPPLSPKAWQAIKEEIWIASTLAQTEAEIYARQAMREWMGRVRARIDNDFVPWYSGYWTQQWIGLKAVWYELNREEAEAQVEQYLAKYLTERFYDLVLEPAGVESNPQTITEQAAALYVRLLSTQLQCIPRTYLVPPQSLQTKLHQISLIALPGSAPARATLSQVFESDDLAGTPAYDALVARSNSVETPQRGSPDQERLAAVAEDAVARLFAELPVRAGGGAAAAVAGEALGLFISLGVAAWSAVAHDQEKAAIESRLRQALDAGLEDMWHTLMEDPELGVLFPVRHMDRQIASGLFTHRAVDPVTPF